MPFDNAEALALQAEANVAPADSLLAEPNVAPLVLRGIVDGTVPHAIVDGLSGTDGGRALRIGEMVGDVRLLEVGKERAVLAIRGMRTTLFIGRSAPVQP